MSKNFSRSFSCSRSHKIYIRSNKIKLGSSYAYHALWPLSYDLDKIQDRDKIANRCNGGIKACHLRVTSTSEPLSRRVFLTLHYHMHFINNRNEEIQAKILEFSDDRMQQFLHVLILGMWQFYCQSYFALISLCYMVIRYSGHFPEWNLCAQQSWLGTL